MNAQLISTATHTLKLENNAHIVVHCTSICIHVEVFQEDGGLCVFRHNDAGKFFQHLSRTYHAMKDLGVYCESLMHLDNTIEEDGTTFGGVTCQRADKTGYILGLSCHNTPKGIHVNMPQDMALELTHLVCAYLYNQSVTKNNTEF